MKFLDLTIRECNVPLDFKNTHDEDTGEELQSSGVSCQQYPSRRLSVQNEMVNFLFLWMKLTLYHCQHSSFSSYNFHGIILSNRLT